jgi:hypothetical protein
MASIAEKQQFGQAGSVNESGTTAITGDFCAIQILNDAVFSLITDSLASGDAITTLTLPAGLVIYGKFTAFTLTSGAVRAYMSAELR